MTTTEQIKAFIDSLLGFCLVTRNPAVKLAAGMPRRSSSTTKRPPHASVGGPEFWFGDVAPGGPPKVALLH